MVATMVTDEELPTECPSCHNEAFVGRKSAQTSIGFDDGGTTDIETYSVTKTSPSVWDEAECDHCGKKIVIDGELAVDFDDMITVNRDANESSLNDFANSD